MKRISALVGVLGVLLLMVPSGALASSTCQSYSPQTCASTGNTPASTASANASSSGTLPFTGLDVVLLLAGGGTLLGAGLVVRRMSRRLN
jgi:hypothetical protein